MIIKFQFYSSTMIITIRFYRISNPQPQCITHTTNLSPLETISFPKSVSQYLLCKEIHCVIFQIPHVSNTFDIGVTLSD